MAVAIAVLTFAASPGVANALLVHDKTPCSIAYRGHPTVKFPECQTDAIVGQGYRSLTVTTPDGMRVEIHNGPPLGHPLYEVTYDPPGQLTVWVNGDLAIESIVSDGVCYRTHKVAVCTGP
jgi:hypothetical protein